MELTKAFGFLLIISAVFRAFALQDECSPENDDCENNQQCIRIGKRYECGCPKGFQETSKYCIDIDECYTDRTGWVTIVIHNCIFDHFCRNVPGGFVCDCGNGYAISDNGGCQDIDECVNGSHNCLETQECVNTVGSYKCLCKGGFTFNDLEHICMDEDECLLNSHTCRQYGKNFECRNLPGSYYCYKKNFAKKSAQSTCQQGFDTNEMGLCYDVDECAERRHDCNTNERCVNRAGGFSCECNWGYAKDERSNECMDIDECATGSHTCGRGGCINKDGTYACAQDVSYIDQCDRGVHNCTEKQVCNAQFGGFRCVCRVGYERSADLSCTNIDECALEDACGQNERCIDKEGTYVCECVRGFQTDSDGTCVDIDECSNGVHDCKSNEMCVNHNGGFICVCKLRYIRDELSNDCLEIKDCTRGLTCGLNQQCVDIRGMYVCECQSGFQTYNNETCVDIDECDENAHTCLEIEFCQNMEGGYECTCSKDHCHYLYLRNLRKTEWLILSRELSSLPTND